MLLTAEEDLRSHSFLIPKSDRGPTGCVLTLLWVGRLDCTDATGVGWGAPTGSVSDIPKMAGSGGEWIGPNGCGSPEGVVKCGTGFASGSLEEVRLDFNLFASTPV